ACLASVVLERYWKAHNVKRRKRVLRHLELFAALTLLATGVFAFQQFRPVQRDAMRDFDAESIDSDGAKHGLFAPIPFGPAEQDLNAIFKPPLFRVPVDERIKSNEAHPHLLGTDNTGRD